MFDGKYVYLVAHGGMAARCDTSTDFRTRSSWSTFAVPQLAPLTMGFYGAGFDGRYTYFVPNNVAQVGEQCLFAAVLARYDTLASFDAPESWSTFETKSLDKNARGFAGAVFDRRFFYLVPAGTSMTVARFDAKWPPGMPALPHWPSSFL